MNNSGFNDIGFKDFLLNEVNMDVDLSDPNTATAEIKQAARMAKTSPQRLGRQEQLKAKAEMAAAKAEEGPTANIKRQIATLQQRIAQLQMRLASMEKREGVPQE